AILQRMRELVIQAANLGTQEEEDLNALQNEIAQLIQEIDKISERTEFNEKKLLDGSYTGQVFQIGANAGQTMSVEINAMSAEALGVDKLDVSAFISDSDPSDPDPSNPDPSNSDPIDVDGALAAVDNAIKTV